MVVENPSLQLREDPFQWLSQQGAAKEHLLAGNALEIAGKLDASQSILSSSSTTASSSSSSCSLPSRCFRDRFRIPPLKSFAAPPAANKSGGGGPLSPVDEDEESVYLVGHSLGLQPKETRELLLNELDKWGQFGVNGHFSGDFPWMPIDEFATPAAARVLGAKVEEVCIMNTLSVNLHLMFTTFYRPERNRRFKILYEAQAFPSDFFVFQSQAQLHDLDPEEALLPVPADPDTDLVDEERLCELLREDREIAVLCLGAVQYYSGQFFDVAKITKVAHENGVVALFDLAHAVGNVPLELHKWNVDAASFCTYKYLNSGPGCIGGFFVHERHLQTMNLLDAGAVQTTSTKLPSEHGAALSSGTIDEDDVLRERSSYAESTPTNQQVIKLRSTPSIGHISEEAGEASEVPPMHGGSGDEHVLNREWSKDVGTKRLAGWWSHDKSTRFEMKHKLQPAAGAKAFSLSNPGVMLMMCLIASLRVFDQTSMEDLRVRSKRLTAFLFELLDEVVPEMISRKTTGAAAAGEEELQIKPFTIITPKNPDSRGSMLTLKFKKSDTCKKVHEAVEARGVVVDYRRPDALRITPAPLYNTFTDLARFCAIFSEELAKLS
ncbi:unnamed protein product [Amoebophrya sp. A120]|nr:unnamed protein product [Amoebophrya sp. A120]|eukprot:GSA120T00016654001.1